VGGEPGQRSAPEIEEDCEECPIGTSVFARNDIFLDSVLAQGEGHLGLYYGLQP
jgi:hypothetical protein